MKNILVLGVGLLLSLQAAAGNGRLTLVGEARLNVLFWQVYQSRLYTEDGEYLPDTRPLRLEIQYLRDISADALVSRTALEWRRLGADHPLQDSWLNALSRLWPDVKEGDVLSVELDEHDRSTFHHNWKQLGVIEHVDFGRNFLDIWLSPDTSQPELRQALIGQL